jgi:hypothetical protein
VLEPGESWIFTCTHEFSSPEDCDTTQVNQAVARANAEGEIEVVSNEADAEVTINCAGGEGCTPGFWKANAQIWGAVAWPDSPDINPTDTVESLFDAISNGTGYDNADFADDSLLKALGYTGGSGADGAAKILLRAGVAAALNAADDEVNYPMSLADVIEAVNNALESGDRATMLALASELDANNNLGCFQNQQGERIEEE